jgi:hypothetical protein
MKRKTLDLHERSRPACTKRRAREVALDARCEELVEECGACKRAAASSAATARTTAVACSEQVCEAL